MSAYVPNRDLELARDVLRLADDLGALRDQTVGRPALANTLDIGRELMVTVARELLAGVPE